MEAWADRTGNKVLSIGSEGGVITASVQKGAEKKVEKGMTALSQDKTMVIFSGDLDKALAAFIIANARLPWGIK